MVFLSPLALLGLLGAVVPPLLHLFQRRQPPRVEFPAVRYLRQSEREAQRSVRLTHLLLMVLRVAAVVLLVVAAARPVVPGLVGAVHEPTAVVLVLDNSLSSGAVSGGARVFDQLAARAGETLRGAGGGDLLWLIGADGLARRGSAADLEAAVGAMRPLARRLDLAAAVRTAAALLARSGYARREIHVYSDLQASALEGAADSGVADVAILAFHPAGDAPANRAVIAAQPQPAVWLAGAQGAGVAVRVGGAPADPLADRAVTASVDGRAGGRALARSGGAVVLAAPRLSAGWRRGVVTLDADELRADDERPFAVRVARPAAVSLAAREAAAPFLPEALGVLRDAGRVRAEPGLEVTLGGLPAAPGAGVLWPPSDPAALGALNRALASAGLAWRFGAAVVRDDSLTSDLPELSGVRVHARRSLELAGDSAGSVVLARAGGAPWLVRQGAVVLLASRLVPEETTLPVSRAFVPFVDALVNRVARGEAGVLAAAPGDPVALPGGVTALAFGDSLLPAEGGRTAEAPGVPGVYALRSGADTSGLLVVAPDPRESDLVRADPAVLRGLFPRARVVVTAEPRVLAAERFRGAGRTELTGLLLALAMGVLVVEAVLAAGGLARRA